MYDKEREDGPFTPRVPTVPSALPSTPPIPEDTPQNTDQPSAQPVEWEPLEDIFVTHGVATLSSSNPLAKQEKTFKNPVSHWRVSKKAVTGAKIPI
jgi:catabolite repression protein CreC